MFPLLTFGEDMKAKRTSPENAKKIKDLILNVLAYALLNVVIQFLLYPFMERKLESEAFGVMLTMISIVSVTANTLGTAANYSRLVSERPLSPTNGDYLWIMGVGSGIFATLGTLVGAFYLLHFDMLTADTAILFFFLIVATAFRQYSDVGYKLDTNFVKYFFFYAIISLGYVVGILIFDATVSWIIAILLGEVLGVLFSAFSSNIYKKPLRRSINFKAVLKSASLLILPYFLDNLIVNADRLILPVLVDATAGSEYYIASIFGKVVALLTVPINAVVISYLIRYDKGLSKKLWAVFTVGGSIVGAVALGGCVLFSHLLLPYMYPSHFEAASAYIFPAVASQIFFFVSGVLLVVLLRFRGEKKQFIVNSVYAVVFFVAVIIGEHFFGFDGFVWAALIANFLRFAVVTIWGFLPPKDGDKKEIAEQAESTPLA